MKKFFKRFRPYIKEVVLSVIANIVIPVFSKTIEDTFNYAMTKGTDISVV